MVARTVHSMDPSMSQLMSPMVESRLAPSVFAHADSSARSMSSCDHAAHAQGAEARCEQFHGHEGDADQDQRDAGAQIGQQCSLIGQ